MQHLGTKTFCTERLILRPFTIDDAEIMFFNWASDDVVTQYLPWDSHSNVEITQEILSDWVNSYKNPDFYQWCIEYKKEAYDLFNKMMFEIQGETVKYLFRMKFGIQIMNNDIEEME